MSTQEECQQNRYGKYSILFLNKQGLTRHQITKKFSIFGDDDYYVHCLKESNRVFVNFTSKENAIKARETFPELHAVFANDKNSSSQKPQACNEKKDCGHLERKGGYYSKDDSDNKSCSSVASSSSNRQSYHNSKTPIAKSSMNDATPGGGQNKTKQKNYSGNQNMKQENRELTQAAGSSTQKSHSSNGSLAESTANGQNTTKQTNNSGDQNKKPETKESTPSASNSSCSLDGSNVEDLDEIPLLVSAYEVEIMENLRTVEAIVVVLCNLPPWLYTGDVYRLIFESTGLWPLEVEVFHREKRTVQHSAYVHFRDFKEAEKCVKIMNYMWVEYRQLICVLADEVLAHLRN